MSRFALSTLLLLALAASVAPHAHAVDLPTIDQVFTATTHPMKYAIALPRNWSPERIWPVIIAPNAHYGGRKQTIQMLEPLSEARKAGFIIVSPVVINADPVAQMAEYRGAVAEQIHKADEALGQGRRDDDNRANFDSAGIRAIIQDVQRLYHGEDRVYITGFSSSTHIVYLFLFTHPELLKGAVINSGVYRGRGVDENQLPFLKAPERARVAIKFIVGESDGGFKVYTENWAATKALLIQSGHQASKIEEEIIHKGNAEDLGAGHQWFPTRIMDFFTGVEKAGEK